MTEASKQPPPPPPVEVLPAHDEAQADLSRRSARLRHRGVWSRVFDLRLRGWARLALTCLAVGLVVRAADLNPFAAGFNLPDAMGSIVTAIARMIAWTVGNGWAPFLVGTLVVVPLFVLWRLAVLPFRRKDRIAPQAGSGPRWGR